MTDAASPLRIAYLVNQYPAVSHSFIRREIQELERQGLPVLRLAFRGHDGVTVDAGDRREQELTRYIFGSGAVVRLLGHAVALAVTRPLKVLRTIAETITLGRRADRSMLAHFGYFLAACAVTRMCRAHGIDHLHAHFGTNPAAVAMLAKLLGGPRYSFTVHGPEEFDKAGTLKLADKVAHAAFVVAISSFGRSQLLRWVRREDREKVHVVHCGLQDGYGHGAPAVDPANNSFACIGRLSEQKGHAILIEAWRLLDARGIRPRLVLVGDGDLRPEIERAIAEYGLGDRIELVGWGDENAVRESIVASRGMVLASFAEGLPVVIMEAMALGRPVITTYVAGIPELVRDGIDGLLVPAGDAVTLADAIARLLAMDGTELSAMSDAARARVAGRHAIGTEAAKLSRLFAGATR